MNNQDIVDIYDENKNKTGRTKIRHKDTLLKDILPLKWECNGGALLSGEDVIDGLIREIYEELGIKLLKEEAIFLKTAKNNHRFKEIYLFKKDIEIEEIRFTDGESIDAKWIDINEFISMFNNGEIVYNVDFDINDYENSLLLLGLS